MINDLQLVKELFKGRFLTPLELIQTRLQKVKAFVFDWDGVFNNGAKDENGSSPFSEVDAMGINMLRFNYYLHTNHVPLTVIISGEKNKAAFTLAKREHFNANYYNLKNKKEGLAHLCNTFNLKPQEIAFVFDDILDLSMAENCGLRLMIGRQGNPLLTDMVVRNKLADYITASDGANHAVREATELLIGLNGNYTDTISHRMHFSERYKQYLNMRNTLETVFYTTSENGITEKQP
jgi:3-deoxy-D-manno-octulosonate 8-phosphate phosphatase (KDO 8-P phosphatase)